MQYLCDLGYMEAQVRQMMLPSQALNTSCSGGGTPYSDGDLNYPAIDFVELGSAATVRRMVAGDECGPAEGRCVPV